MNPTDSQTSRGGLGAWLLRWLVPALPRADDTTKRRDVYSVIETWLRVVIMLGLVLIGVLIASSAVLSLWRSRSTGLQQGVAAWLNATLLIFIVLEIAQTVRKQLQEGERLTQDLVCTFLAIGIVSSIRHLLAVGAEMTLQSQPPGSQAAEWLAFRRGQMLELCVSAGIILLLVGCWWAANGRRSANAADSREGDERASPVQRRQVHVSDQRGIVTVGAAESFHNGT